MKILTLTSLALGIVILLGVSSQAEAVTGNQNDRNVVMTNWRHQGPYYYGDPYYYAPAPGYYYNRPLLCVAGLCI